MLESKIQAKVIAEAKKQGFLVLKTIKCNITGYPDITLFKDGKTLFIEVKNEIGKQSEIQKYVQKLIEAQGFKYYIVRSLEEFKEKLKQLK